MNPSENVAAIKQAHREGTLLAHMLEMKLDSPRLPKLLNVLNGQPGAQYLDEYRSVPSTPEGFAGLPTTALKEGCPMPVWTVDSFVGFLFDAADTANVTPVHVCGTDAFSQQKSAVLDVSVPPDIDNYHFQPVVDAQPLALSSRVGNYLSIDILDASKRPQYAAQSREALQKLWPAVAEKSEADRLRGYDPTPDLNEVSIVAHLKGVKGLVVVETCPNLFKGAAKAAQLAKRVEAAWHLRDMLAQKRPELADLPIMTYDPHRAQDQLVAILPRQLAQPELFYLQRHAAPAECHGARER